MSSDGDEFCVYVVPPFHFGLPVYDPDEMFSKLYEELTRLNYQLLAWPNARRLFIFWYAEEETAVDNIRNAMRLYQEQHENFGVNGGAALDNPNGSAVETLPDSSEDENDDRDE